LSCWEVAQPIEPFYFPQFISAKYVIFKKKKNAAISSEIWHLQRNMASPEHVVNFCWYHMDNSGATICPKRGKKRTELEASDKGEGTTNSA
jgi:hypothetical protein